VEAIKNIWDQFVHFLSEYDVQKIAEALHQLDWRAQLTNPVTWIVGLPLLAFIIWKRKVNLLILCCSFVAFIYLLQNTLPPTGESVPLNKLLEFLGGSVVLLAVNIYFMILREK
jgi:hypothetical protein